MVNENNLIGKEILNYRIESLIGKGGMGSVYLAANKHINQKVAIKMLNENLAGSDIIRQKFKGEAKTLQALDHPNIVHFLNYVENEDGVFLIMEYIDGITLDDFINTKQGLIVETKAYDLFSQILDAFTYAHKRGVVHRDIKPANIILTHDNEGNFVVRVLDFGIAKIISESNEDEKNMMVGTPLYMSPEQIRGEDVDERSDIYSLGVLLHQMLTGRAPYDATTLSETNIQKKVVEEKLPRMKEYYQYVSDRMQKIVDKATSKSPAERYNNCAAFRKDFLPKPPTSKWIKIAIAATVTLLLGGGYLFWDYNYHTKINYYKDYVEQWGAPVGVGKADYKHREGSYQFEKLKGKINRVLYVNSKNNIIEHHDSEHTERIINARYYYTADGKVNYVEIMDRNNKILYKKVYDENLKTVIFKYADEFGAEMCLAASTTRLFTNSFNNEKDDKGRISRYLISYDENGYVKRLQYAGFQNVLVSDADGLFGKEYVVDAKGRAIEERFLGYDGTPKTNKVGLAIKKFEYDDNDDWTKVTYYAANGELSSDGNGCPVVVLDNDKWGNRIKETYSDGDGNLALRTDAKVAGYAYQRNDEGYCITQSAFGTDGLPCYNGNLGYASIESEYDDNGYLAKTAYKDIDGNLVITSDGNAIIILKNDERGNILEEKFLDVNHEICEIKYGFAKVAFEYDSLGNQTAMFFYDTRDSLCIISGGYAGLRTKYNDRNKAIEQTYYGTDNLPCENTTGIVTIKYEYDPRGNQTKVAFYDTDGKTLLLSNEGIAGWRSDYDDNGNEIKRNFFDVDDNATLGNLGYTGWIATYKNDNLEEKKFIDKSSQMVYVVYYGYAGIKYKYDERSNVTEEYPYNAKGNLIGYIKRCQYDNHDNIIETAYYDQNNNPVFGKRGCFRIVSVYDNRNQEIEHSYYNTDNRLFAPKSDNFAVVRYQYDHKGNNVEAAFFNEYDKPVARKDGYAIRKSEYDAMGRRVRQTFYDENGQPTKPSVMIPESLVEYDKWGNTNYLASADGYGNLIDNPKKGWAVKRWRYNIKGNILEIAFYNQNGEPCLDKDEEAHKITYTYDKQNKKTEERYYSTTGDLRKEDYAIVRYKYNEQRQIAEETYFDYQDKAIDIYNVAHKFVYSYDEQGEYLYLKRYKVNGALEATLKWNQQENKWEFVNTTTTTTTTANWRDEIRKLSKGCPYNNYSKDFVVTTITLTSYGCEIVVNFKQVSKYKATNAELEKYKAAVKTLAQYIKKEAGMPNSTNAVVISYDMSKRELLPRITY